VTSIERTAYPRFRRLTSARVLHVFFTPKAEEIAWDRARRAPTSAAGCHAESRMPRAEGVARCLLAKAMTQFRCADQMTLQWW
jgi:hypothetical protein